MNKSEEIIKDCSEAKALYHEKFKLGPKSMTMLEIVQTLIDKIDDLKDQVSELRYPNRW